jgi:hypothetical protein
MPRIEKRLVVLMKTGAPRQFYDVGRVEWRKMSTMEGGTEIGVGPWLVVFGADGSVMAELLKEAVRGYQALEVERMTKEEIEEMEARYAAEEEDEDEMEGFSAGMRW